MVPLGGCLLLHLTSYFALDTHINIMISVQALPISLLTHSNQFVVIEYSYYILFYCFAQHQACCDRVGTEYTDIQLFYNSSGKPFQVKFRLAYFTVNSEPYA